MVYLFARLLYKGRQLHYIELRRAVPPQRLHIRHWSPVAAMASDGIPRTRENSITKTSAKASLCRKFSTVKLQGVDLHKIMYKSKLTI